MSELLKIAGTGNELRIGDVVFIHGLGGDAHTTWHVANTPDSFWPKWVAQDHPGLGIWSLRFEIQPSELLGTAMPLLDRATNVLAIFKANYIGSRPFVLVTHSYGGLLAKQMLKNAAELGDTNFEDFAKNLKGIVFLSTPHNGSDLARYASFFGSVLRPTTATAELLPDEPHLRHLNTWYRHHSHKRKIKHLSIC